MWTYVFRRCLLLVPTFAIISIAVFSMIHLVPGDPIDSLLGPGSDAADRVALVEKYGLDRPLYAQYFNWMGAFLSGDMGRSITEQRSVAEMIAYNLPFTLRLGAFSLAISFVAGIALGLVSAISKNSLLDHVATVVALLGVTVPAFWLGLILILVFAVNLGWAPVSGSGSFSTLILPSIAAGMGGAGLVARVTRASTIEVLNMDFVQFLYARGISKTSIIFKHVLRNALVPVITILGLRLGWILGGAVTIEIVFGRPGLGSMLLIALKRRDYPVVEASLLFLTLAVIIGAFIADILIAYADPRVRDTLK